MSSKEWKKVTIGQLGKIITGKTPSTSDKNNFGGKYPFITIPDMDGRVYIDRSERTISEKGSNILRSLTLPPNSVMMSCIATVGKCGITTSTSFTNQQINRVICNSDIEPLFLYYLFTQLGEELRASGGGGSVYTNVSKSRFSDIKVLVPALPEQRRIAEILGSLDDKIELNRQMNKTLEAMAQVIFKSWFVDFDPVHAKMEGRQPAGMDAATAALFPNSMDGDVPHGWRIDRIGEIVDVIDCLHSKKPKRTTSGKPLIQLCNILDDGLLDMTDTYYISNDDYKLWVSRMEASPGDCIITNVGRVGAVAQIPYGQNAALGRNMTALRCKKEYPFPTFLIECLLSDSLRKEIDLKTDTGTILDALNVKNIPNLQAPFPTKNILEKFENITRPIRNKMEMNLAENGNLTNLRDTLLPKLMSGHIN